MASGWKFGWKRKATGSIVKNSGLKLEEDSDEETETDKTVAIRNEVFHLSAADYYTPPNTKRKLDPTEDDIAKSKCLQEEGCSLAEDGRWWDAVRKWDMALLRNPRNSKIHEMKAQVLMVLGENFSAVKSAEEAAKLAPTWWVAHQTHGRALLNFGEVGKALKSFSKAVHLNPADTNLRKEDFEWTRSLVQRRSKAEEKQKQKTEAPEESGSILSELSEKELEEFLKAMPGPQEVKEKMFTRSHCGSLLSKSRKEKSEADSEENQLITSGAHIRHIEKNYVLWRDNT